MRGGPAVQVVMRAEPDEVRRVTRSADTHAPVSVLDVVDLRGAVIERRDRIAPHISALPGRRIEADGGAVPVPSEHRLADFGGDAVGAHG